MFFFSEPFHLPWSLFRHYTIPPNSMDIEEFLREEEEEQRIIMTPTKHCASGHELERSIAPDDRVVECGKCHKIMYLEEAMWTCRGCFIDLCLKCYDDDNTVKTDDVSFDDDNIMQQSIDSRFEYLKIKLCQLDGFIDIITSDTPYIVTFEQQEEETYKEMTSIQALKNEQKYLRRRLNEITKELKLQQSIYSTICIQCNVNKSNILMLPCKHLDICGDCEKKADSKTCPRCCTKYDQVIIINKESL